MAFEDRIELLQMWMSEVFDDTIRYGERILTQRPIPNYTEIVAKLHIFKEKIEKGNLNYISGKELDDFQNQVILFLIGWNEVISKQSLQFYNAVAIMNNQKSQFLFDKGNHPFKKLTQNLERYNRANRIIQEIFEYYDNKLVNSVEFHSILFTVIIMAEVVEYYLQDFFSRNVKAPNKKTADTLSEIFSVTKKWKNEVGDYEPDIRMMRNALSHFNFDMTYVSPPDELKITFFLVPKGNEETRWFYSTDLLKFIGNYRSLLHNFEHIIISMQTFSLVHHFQQSK